MNLKKVVLTLVAATTGLSAGLFFGFQVSVIPICFFPRKYSENRHSFLDISSKMNYNSFNER